MTTKTTNPVSINMTKQVKLLTTSEQFEDVILFETNVEGMGAVLKLSEFVKAVIIMQAGDMDKDAIQEAFTGIALKVFPMEELEADFEEIITNAKEKGVHMISVELNVFDLIDTFNNMEVADLLKELFA